MHKFLMPVVMCGLLPFLVECATSRSASRSTSQGPEAETAQMQPDKPTEGVICRKKAVPGSDAKQLVCRPATKAEVAKKRRPKEPGKRLECRRERITGSLIKRTVCRDVWKDKERRDEDQKAMREAQQRAARVQFK